MIKVIWKFRRRNSALTTSSSLATRIVVSSQNKMADEGAFYLEKVSIDDESEQHEYQYEEIPVDEDIISEADEDLDTAVRTIQEASQDLQEAVKKDMGVHGPSVSQVPEVVDDFVRNFLVRMGMMRTLDCFQTEWYKHQQKGLLREENVATVPDIYTRNQELDQQVKVLRREAEKFKMAAMKAKDTYIKLRKERDFHRMHHKRVVQEKNKLITDIKRLKRHYSSYEPTLKQLKHKYEVAMKEKMLTKLERDRAVGQVTGLQSTLHNLENGGVGVRGQGVSGRVPRECNQLEYDQGTGPSQKKLREAQAPEGGGGEEVVDGGAGAAMANDSEFPQDSRVNPQLMKVKGPAAHLSRTGGFRLTNTVQGHSLAISSMALHPRKQVLATVSDDHTWKMWAVPSGDVIMTGEGHSDWVSDCDFHPSGAQLATASGDRTVKIWDFAKAECILTLSEHTHAVWGCSFHSCGDFLATCSMDGTSKVWDLNSQRCRYTLRGHADSVNSILFLPYSNTLLTSSADKTLSLWDARTGLCAQTFYGHMHSINHATFNLRGDAIASCDSYGQLKLWDVRTVSPVTTVDVGPHPVNRLDFDPSGQVVAGASNDGGVKMYEIVSGKVGNLVGHEDAVQCLLFDRMGEFLISGASDATLRIWS